MYGNILEAWILAGGIADLYDMWKGKGLPTGQEEKTEVPDHVPE
jgi:hypothetical protein